MNFAYHLVGFGGWWYSGGLKRIISFLGAIFLSIWNFFAVGTTLKTLFSPWKKVLTGRRPGISGFFDWIIDNLISRFVGFVVRLTTLATFLLVELFCLVLATVVILFWTLYPALFVIFIWGLAR